MKADPDTDGAQSALQQTLWTGLHIPVPVP